MIDLATQTFDCEQDLGAAGKPPGVLHHGPSHAVVVASMLWSHLLHHQFVPSGLGERRAQAQFFPVEKPGVGQVRASGGVAAQHKP